jgi:hypothetical protein
MVDASVCGVCDCNGFFIIAFLIGVISGILVDVVMKEAERRKKAKQ